jgi:hypothetical protein
MPLLVDDAFDWLDRAEQVREAAEQLTDPGPKQAVLQRAESFGRLARTAADRARVQKCDVAPGTPSDLPG